MAASAREIVVNRCWPSTTSQRGNVASFCGDGASTTEPRKCALAFSLVSSRST